MARFVTLASVGLVGVVVGAIGAYLVVSRNGQATASAVRGHRVAAVIDVEALRAIERGDPESAKELLGSQLRFEILGMSPKYTPPSSNADQVKCQLQLIRAYRDAHPLAGSRDSLSQLESEVLATFPTVEAGSNDLACGRAKM